MVVEVVDLAIMNIVTAAEMIIAVVAEVEVVVEEQGSNVSSAGVIIMHQRAPITVTSDEYQR